MPQTYKKIDTVEKEESVFFENIQLFSCVQTLEAHQHFVAVVFGHDVAEGFDVLFNGVVYPFGHGALDVGALSFLG